jgi:prepilin-type N-terminal cleavage/methylation domain-containing protein
VTTDDPPGSTLGLAVTTIHRPHPVATTKECLMKALIQNRRKHSDEGFTLIELLLVIIILGILAAVVVFSVRGVSDRGQSSACKTSRAATIVAIEAFYAKNGFYPASLSALQPDFIADLPNPSPLPPADAMAVNGPTKSGSNPPTKEWTLQYAGGGASYTFTATVLPANGSC